MWVVTSPGVLIMSTTTIHIHLMDNWHTGHRYTVYWGVKEIGHSATLGYAKLIAQDWVKDLLEMGIEP